MSKRQAAEPASGAEWSAMADTDERYVLRCLADLYDQTQRVRIATGERLRAYVQRRDQSLGGGTRLPTLSEIRAGSLRGPVPILGETYYRHSKYERELRVEMRRVLLSHPVFSWLDEQKGIGPTLSCKLLARLDIARAPTPSSFWRYCGLVPRRAHDDLPHYDRAAKKLCYLLSISLIRYNDEYRDLYEATKQRLAVVRADWSDSHIRLASLRFVQKRFLLNLWIEWNRCQGTPHGTSARALARSASW
jgi:transposase